MDGTDGSQQIRMLGPAHDVHQRYVLFETKLDEHLTEVRRRRRMNDPAVALARIVSIIPSAVSGLTKDDAPSLAGVPSGRTRHTDASAHPVLRVHRPAGDDDGPSEQRLRLRGAPASTTVPAPSLPTGNDRRPDLPVPEPPLRESCAHHPAIRRPADRPAASLSAAANNSPRVGRIDRRLLHADEDLAGPGGPYRDMDQQELHRAPARSPVSEVRAT